MASGPREPPEWTFLTNHAVALLAIRDNPNARIAELASQVGVTERTCQRLVNDLVDAGYVGRQRVGRRNVYVVNPDTPLRASAVHHVSLRALLDLEIRPAAPRGLPNRARRVQRGAVPVGQRARWRRAHVQR